MEHGFAAYIDIEKRSCSKLSSKGNCLSKHNNDVIKLLILRVFLHVSYHQCQMQFGDYSKILTLK